MEMRAFVNEYPKGNENCMKRPLLLAALFLVIVASLRLAAGKGEGAPPGSVSLKELDTSDELLLTGQVYQKDDTSIYLRSVILLKSDVNDPSNSSNLSNPSNPSNPSNSSNPSNPSNPSNSSNSSNPSNSNNSKQIPCTENIKCETERAPEIPLGSMAAFRGVFSPYSGATNPGEFDSAVYYRTLEVGGRLRKTELVALSAEHWALRERLYRLKCYLKDRLYRLFPEREAAVMSALLLGDKSDLDSDLRDLYKRNGILHILSISSLHITIIGMSVYRLLRRTGMPVFAAAVGGSVLLLFYGCMTGFSVSACRAIGMYVIRMLGEVAGRTYDMLTALGVMAAAMVLRNPYYLQNSGFLLSFASVLGIGVVCPALTPKLPGEMSGNRSGAGGRFGKKTGDHSETKREKIFGMIRQKLYRIFTAGLQSMAASLSITLTTLPIQLWFYYEIPVYSVFLNLFVIPFLKPMMITGLLAMFVPGLGLLGSVDYFILKGYEFLCGCFDLLPFRTWNPGCPKIWQIAVYYFVLTTVVSARYWGKHYEEKHSEERHSEKKHSGEKHSEKKHSEKKHSEEKDAEEKDAEGSGFLKRFLGGRCGAAAGVCVLCLSVMLMGLRPTPENSVSLLDIGQGDCILVRTASGRNYLFDCGSSSRSNIGKYVVIPYLKYNGIHTIDAMFLSHPDADHISGALELLASGAENNIAVGQVLLPAIEEGMRQEQLGELLEAAGNAQGGPVPVGYMAAGFRWDCGSAVFTCLHPREGFAAEDVNEYSECFFVEFTETSGTGQAGSSEDGKWTLLLTGDVQGDGEAALLEELKRRGIKGIDVLKVAHHGSRNSTPEELLEQLCPKAALISSGRNNRYGHPHAELLERLEANGVYIVQTARSGAVKVTFREGGIRIWSYLSE